MAWDDFGHFSIPLRHLSLNKLNFRTKKKWYQIPWMGPTYDGRSGCPSYLGYRLGNSKIRPRTKVNIVPDALT